MIPRPRRGFALLAVVWIMLGVAALGLAISLSARGAVATTRNRIESTLAGWRAEECVARARTVVSGALRAGAAGHTREISPWLSLAAKVRESGLVTACPGTVIMAPVGIAIDINATGPDQIRKALLSTHTPPEAADSMVDAVLDWRDRDDVVRPSGAEREWYLAQRREGPRNSPLEDIRELSRVRGFEELATEGERDPSELAGMFTVEPGRIVLDMAPEPVLASLAGFTGETVARLMERRLRGAPPLNEILSLGAELAPASRDSLHRYYADLVQLVALEPDAWIIIARATSGRDSIAPGPTATIELRVVRAGTRAAIVRRRTSW